MARANYEKQIQTLKEVYNSILLTLCGVARSRVLKHVILFDHLHKLRIVN